MADGLIPYTVGQLDLLQKLDLSSNSLVGSIPNTIEKLKRDGLAVLRPAPFISFGGDEANVLGGAFLYRLFCLLRDFSMRRKDPPHDPDYVTYGQVQALLLPLSWHSAPSDIVGPLEKKLVMVNHPASKNYKNDSDDARYVMILWKILPAYVDRAWCNAH
ncbi:hypothetical protein RJ640_013445 [Escallonia rubra]|uniref:Uncharacterized protein n=1 Tax=Escallonia rubra TaxID=112253 RepID=A0AA88RJZ7_9ASTE|nr:hypothetical protein RJ640_013445 [Escallonia rubra]